MEALAKIILKIRESSNFCLQLENYYLCFIWTLKSIYTDKKISPPVGNFLLAMILNVTLGFAVFILIDQTSTDLVQIAMDCIELVVLNLRLVLKWLMGAPGGLKLNTAFNNVLGKFFLHQINLWWKFIGFWRDWLDIIFFISKLVGCFGITLQAAIISDLISFVTFHVYCIYLFIARLFNIQLAGLKALLRLFVGRKMNPLRDCVDSCKYTSQQLFVGTVAFTVLLFLLPTTTIYYVVFTSFRLILMFIQGVFIRFCYTLTTLPIYTIALWSIGSKEISGSFHYEVGESGRSLVRHGYRIHF